MKILIFNHSKFFRLLILGKDKVSDSPKEEEKAEPEGMMEKIASFFADKLHLHSSEDDDSTEGRQVLETVDLAGVANAFKAGKFTKIVTMVGAGISTSAGIPDFRSPSSGLYHNLQKYNLPYPEAIFEIEYFRENPQAFFKLAKELYPGNFKPTPSHYFVKMLAEKGLLLRHYTQNIDTLERVAEINEDLLVEAHGTFYTNHCIDCSKEYSMEWVKQEIFKDSVPTCVECNGIVKPDIVFFGENLPEKFYVLPHQDFKQCDLLIIMGTSLTVQPFASLIDFVSDHCVRLLINREKVGKSGGGGNFFRSMLFGEGFCFDLPGNRRDVAFEIDCDSGCQQLADLFGFGDELRKMIVEEHEKIDTKNKDNSSENTEKSKETELEEKIETKDDKETTEEKKSEDEESREKLLKDEKTSTDSKN